MKKLVLAIAVVAIGAATPSAVAQETFKVVTIVESIVPAGVGRSRIIENGEEQDVDAATTERYEGKDTEQGKVRRKDLKVDRFSETKLLNFYSMTGINFQNIASNDAVIEAKINSLIEKGWKLTYVTSGVESDAGKDDGTGIFITRLFFSR